MDVSTLLKLHHAGLSPETGQQILCTILMTQMVKQKEGLS